MRGPRGAAEREPAIRASEKSTRNAGNGGGLGSNAQVLLRVRHLCIGPNDVLIQVLLGERPSSVAPDVNPSEATQL